MQGTRMVKAIY